jgi:hypothetical protein
MMTMTEKQIARFWAKVNVLGPDDCWEWQAYLNRGYGTFTIENINFNAHRIAYELTYGPIPEGLLCCHSCDNRACVNPKHLFLGTYQDNMDDMAFKGRNKRKLSEKQVHDIRRLYALEDHMTQRELGKLFKVTHVTILKIVNRIKWKHI